ncbi:MAG: SAVED domain-containing protein [Methylococcales bacterium]|nr:SAVED domain-containing protein [Methylococcales bacterium]MDD5631018.1 SAVED domain-containing protein [Methylococcales bacterium]
MKTEGASNTQNIPTQPGINIGLGETALKDVVFNQWLKAALTNKHIIVLAYASHRCKVFDDEAIADTPLSAADPGKESSKTLKKLAKAGLLRRIELPMDELIQSTTADPTWKLLKASETDVTEWLKKRNQLFGQGRGKAISESTARLVWQAAAGRCMYRGCGNDLGVTPLTTKVARVAYLAHIVASDPAGPRGDSSTSHALSDNPENIMLMCDAHHRLIDRIDEDGHPVTLLRDMRLEHVSMVRKMLDGLAFPRTQAITLFGDIANIPTVTSEHDIRSSMLARKLGPLPDVIHAIRRTQRDDRLRPDFWETLLHEHELDIRDFVRFGKQTLGNGGFSADILAVFPLHLVPILVLAGRIIGEARCIGVFQYDRHRKSWQWDLAAMAQPVDTFQVNDITVAHADEILLSLELTASIDEQTLPENIANQVRDGTIPWVRITATQPDAGCICHPDDLDQFTTVARKAIRIIQDEIRPSRIHLLGVSPASTLFRFGQLLQAGHHSAYTVYDRPDRGNPFRPALSIEGQHVTSATSSSNESPKIIQLR